MKRKTYLQIVFILFSFLSMGQEICDNGIDDDNDGLIDLNDQVDCICNTFTATTDVTSLIQNPSFEEYTSCPTNINSPSQTGIDEFLFCKGWAEATNGTVDYMNSCGFIHPAVINQNLHNFPDGNGIIGLILTKVGMEAVGTCLNSSLNGGTSYTLQFNLASFKLNNFPPQDTVFLENFSPVELTLYGAKSCSDFPLPEVIGCPTVDSNWMKIGATLYSPNRKWEEIFITFTPQTDVKSIILTGPCNLPDDYPGYSDIYFDGLPVPYFLMDNLILNESSLFPLGISKSGSYCTNDIVLTTYIPVDGPPNPILQWYKDGIAIVGAKGASYSVPAGMKGVGNYQVRLTDGNICGLSSKMTILEESAPVISLTSDASISQGDSVSLLASGGTNYTWSPTEGLSCNNCANPIASPSHSTEYCVEVSNGNACSATKCVNVKINFLPKPCGELFIPNSFSPNGDNINDKLEVKINEACVTEYSLQIFDRWGEKVFESTKISESWDGKHNGKELDNAAFVYHLKMKLVNSEKYIKKSGNVSIIK